jgi:hypothetical protein
VNVVVELLIFMDTRRGNSLELVPGDTASQAKQLEQRLESAEFTYTPLIDIVDYETK